METRRLPRPRRRRTSPSSPTPTTRGATIDGGNEDVPRLLEGRDCSMRSRPTASSSPPAATSAPRKPNSTTSPSLTGSRASPRSSTTSSTVGGSSRLRSVHVWMLWHDESGVSGHPAPVDVGRSNHRRCDLEGRKRGDAARRLGCLRERRTELHPQPECLRPRVPFGRTRFSRR